MMVKALIEKVPRCVLFPGSPASFGFPKAFPSTDWMLETGRQTSGEWDLAQNGRNEGERYSYLRVLL